MSPIFESSPLYVFAFAVSHYTTCYFLQSLSSPNFTCVSSIPSYESTSVRVKLARTYTSLWKEGRRRHGSPKHDTRTIYDWQVMNRHLISLPADGLGGITIVPGHDYAHPFHSHLLCAKSMRWSRASGYLRDERCARTVVWMRTQSSIFSPCLGLFSRPLFQFWSPSRSMVGELSSDR
jgi:hypothetical protein